MKLAFPTAEVDNSVRYVDFRSREGTASRGGRYRKLEDKFTALLEKRDRPTVDAKDLKEMLETLPAGTMISVDLN